MSTKTINNVLLALVALLLTLGGIVAVIFTITPRPSPVPLTGPELSNLVVDYAAKHGYQSVAEADKRSDLDIVGLGGRNELQIKEICSLATDADKDGWARIRCERSVSFWLDDPRTSDILLNSVIVTIHGDGSVEASKGRGWFSTMTPLDTAKTVAAYGLGDLITKYTPAVGELYFKINFNTGETLP